MCQKIPSIKEKVCTEWGKIFASHVTDKAFVDRIYEELLHLNDKKTN